VEISPLAHSLKNVSGGQSPDQFRKHEEDRKANVSEKVGQQGSRRKKEIQMVSLTDVRMKRKEKQLMMKMSKR
jgi:hypothetical protein